MPPTRRDEMSDQHRADDGQVADCASGACGCGSGNGAAAGASEANGAAGGTSRRDFLKVIGASGAGAAAFGCGQPPFADKLLPHLVQEENIIPGRNDTYATALGGVGPEPFGVHARRVIKLEGNPEASTNRGRLSAIGQSALQDLYDPDRIPNPLRRAQGAAAGTAPADDPRAAFEDATWDEAIAAAGAAVQQGTTVLLTGAVTGTGARLIDNWVSATGAEHVAYEAFELTALREANRLVFGTAELPSYQLEQADRIVCFGADFLGTWLAPTELSARFAEARDVDSGRHAKFTFVGPRASLTGGNADERIQARAGTEGLVAFAVARIVAEQRGLTDLAAALSAYTVDAIAGVAGVEAEAIEHLGQELVEAHAPVALPPGVEGQGVQATAAHVAVALLNYACGALGTTVRFDNGPVRGITASFAETQELISRMAAGRITTLIISGTNPAFTLPESAGFGAALASVQNVIVVGPHLDETAAAAGWILPCHHELESWGDVETAAGETALAQPVMRPIFDTRQRENILMQVAEAAGVVDGFGAADYAAYLQAAWEADQGAGQVGDDWWFDALRRGGSFADVRDTMFREPPALGQEWRQQLPAVGEFAAADGTQLVVFPTVQFYDGRGANRGWMQEMPEPVTQLVWNSWVEMHPTMADGLGVEHGDVVRVESGAGAVEAPVFVNAGLRSDAVAIPIGQGHTAYGRNAMNRGVNPLNLLPATTDALSGSLAFAGVSVQVTATGRKERLVQTQGSDTDLGREIAELLHVDAARAEIQDHHADPSEIHSHAWDSDPNSPYRWAMTIDLNLCTGCGNCITACYAENNIPVVGEDDCAMRREMSWMRVHRFHEETADGGYHTAHTPMLCQHCGDAPCEPVCPVYATYHNPEGLNVQVYNRCVGTRYCANNCPYTVRRFNWWTHEYPFPLNLQLNPDITVREKGVMDKCTFCVQRINRARVDAKEEGRQIAEGEVVTACQQSCPTEAIVFGNLKDPDSRVSQVARSARAYHILSEVGTRPGITYLKGVTHAELPEDDHGHGAAEGGEDHGEEVSH
jgi:molybdopterin-containing oxidoreductase family iron-sulfur binding subunit